MIKAKSIRDPVSDDDGLRVLVEPSWPKNVGREKVILNMWLKDLAPSPKLSARLSDNVIDWEDFLLLYSIELDKNRDYFPDLQVHNHNGGITFLHGSSDKDRNAAVALKMILEGEDREVVTPA